MLRWKAGAGYVDHEGTTFRVWSPTASSIEVIITSEDGGAKGDPISMKKSENGRWEAKVESAGPGTLYKFKVDGKGPFPDVTSRYQPHGIHGPSCVVDSTKYKWNHEGFVTRNLGDCVIYEMHIGTFTNEGTYQAAASKLEYLADLGVNTLEIMPLADYPGKRNWGYDGVNLYAPCRAYGTPDDLRYLVDRAHVLGFTVLLDVVYNHLGPDGNYTSCYTNKYMSDVHQTPWGAALNLDGEDSEGVRSFLMENAVYWLNEFHFDGFRFDATHALVDDCLHPKPHDHFLKQLAGTIHAVDPKLIVTGEDERNLASMIDDWGFDGVWSDDFHHQVRVMTAGDNESYFRYFRGTTDDLATTIKQGWYYVGQELKMLNTKEKVDDKEEKKTRGTDPKGISHSAFVVCIQNHDQVGNRPDGDRIHHVISPTKYLTVSALLLLVPQTPLVWQGQEWACSTAFSFFTDHNVELGKLVTEGRRKEFKDFSAFATRSIESIADPQAEKTFDNSRLKWDEIEVDVHRYTRSVYKRLLQVRKDLVNESVASSPNDSQNAEFEGMEVTAVHLRGSDAPILAMRRRSRKTGDVLALFYFHDDPVTIEFEESGNVDRKGLGRMTAEFEKKWTLTLDTNDLQQGGFKPGQPARITFTEKGTIKSIAFSNLCALLFTAR